MNTTQRLLVALTVFFSLAEARPANASAPPPCIVATLSANGKVLVINEVSLGDPKKPGEPGVLRSEFTIYQRYQELNANQAITGPNTYWDLGPLWSVPLNSTESGGLSCAYTLVPDSAEFLVILSERSSGSGMEIYHRREHPGQQIVSGGPDHGVLVRSVPVEELRPDDPQPVAFISGPPLWYAGGTFHFSADNKALVYQSHGGKTYTISLPTGVVTTP